MLLSEKAPQPPLRATETAGSAPREPGDWEPFGKDNQKSSYKIMDVICSKESVQAYP